MQHQDYLFEIGINDALAIMAIHGYLVCCASHETGKSAFTVA